MNPNKPVLEVQKTDESQNKERLEFFDSLPHRVQLKLQSDPKFGSLLYTLMTRFFTKQREYAEENQEAILETANRIVNNSKNNGKENNPHNFFLFLLNELDSNDIKFSTNSDYHKSDVLELSNILTHRFVEQAKKGF
jgi:hypothetical protein